MKDQFATYEIALKLNELKFNEECLAGFDSRETFHWGEEYYYANIVTGAPLWQQVIDWLRIHHKLAIELDLHIGEYTIYFKKVTKVNRTAISQKFKMPPIDGIFDYREARETAILKALEFVKQK